MKYHKVLAIWILVSASAVVLAMSSTPDIILYDLTRRDPVSSWELHVWKTRLTLNYLELNYTTEWLDYQDIEPTLKATGLPPLPPSEGVPYSLPALKVGDEYVMGVKHTPAVLQKLRPSRNLRLDTEILQRVERICSQMMNALRILWMPKLFSILSEKSKERFSNRKLETANQKGIQAAWEEAAAAIKELQDIIRGNSNGTFILSTGVSYVDFLLVGNLHFLFLVDQSTFDQVTTIAPELGNLHESCKRWTANDT